MLPRILLIALAALLTTACVPYTTGGYTRTEVYRVDRQAYYPSDGYYVVPQPRYYSAPPRYYPAPPRYYAPPPGYYRVPPAPGYRPYAPPEVIIWQSRPRNDYGHRQRYDYGRDRERHDYRQGPRRDGPQAGWPGGPGRGPGGDGPSRHHGQRR